MAKKTSRKSAKVAKKPAARRVAAKPKLLSGGNPGTSRRPVPPVESKHKEVRYFHIHEGDEIDEELVASWIRQASELPGENCL